MSRIILSKFHETEALSPKTSTPATITLLNQKNSSSNSTISFLCLVISIFALIVVLLGVLHLIFKFLQKSPSFFQNRNLNPNPDVFSSSNQLQDLFFLHNSGLDQTAIDALPVFFYGNVTMSLTEPFDCAVCLNEFFDTDKLRLLPVCSHAFHLHCIDTWLLSNSTCPLCRRSLSTSNVCSNHAEALVDPSSGLQEVDEVEGKGSLAERVLSVRFGRFKSTNESQSQRHEGETGMGVPRRCYSMGTHQYFECDHDYVVPLTSSPSKGSKRLFKYQSLNFPQQISFHGVNANNGGSFTKSGGNRSITCREAPEPTKSSFIIVVFIFIFET